MSATAPDEVTKRAQRQNSTEGKDRAAIRGSRARSALEKCPAQRPESTANGPQAAIRIPDRLACSASPGASFTPSFGTSRGAKHQTKFPARSRPSPPRFALSGHVLTSHTQPLSERSICGRSGHHLRGTGENGLVRRLGSVEQAQNEHSEDTGEGLGHEVVEVDGEEQLEGHGHVYARS